MLYYFSVLKALDNRINTVLEISGIRLYKKKEENVHDKTLKYH